MELVWAYISRDIHAIIRVCALLSDDDDDLDDDCFVFRFPLFPTSLGFVALVVVVLEVVVDGPILLNDTDQIRTFGTG